MAVIITSGDTAFTMNGVEYPRIYQPLKQGNTEVGIYNIYDVKHQLKNSTPYGQYTIDGTTYTSQTETISALLNVTYNPPISSDSSLFDGFTSGQFLRSDTADIQTSGGLTFNDGVPLFFGTSAGESRFQSNGSNMYLDLYNGDLIIRDTGLFRYTFERTTGNLNLYSGKLNIGAASINNGLLNTRQAADTAAWAWYADSTGYSNWTGLYMDVNNNFSYQSYNAANDRTLMLNSSGTSYFSGGAVGIGTETPITTAMHLKGQNHITSGGNIINGVLVVEQNNGVKMFIDGNDIDVSGSTTLSASSSTLYLQDYSKAPVQMGGNLKIGRVSGATTDTDKFLVLDGTDVKYRTGAQVFDDLETARIAGSTYYSIQHIQDLFHSAGWTSGGVITSNGDGTVAVTSGTGLIRATDDITDTIYFTDFAANSSLSLTDNDNNYIYVEYNSGTPQVVATTAARTDSNTNFKIGEVFRSGTDLHINPHIKSGVSDHAGKMIRFNQEVMPYAHASGGQISETGTRNIAITSGSFWMGLENFTTGAFDSSGADRFIYYYYNGSAWVAVTSQSQIDNTQYNNVATGLATLTNNRYGVHWVYLGAEATADVYVVYGQGDYLLAQAQDAMPPSTLPDVISSHGFLIGKIIIQKSASSFTSIESAFMTMFNSSVVTEHNTLSGLQGGTTNEYYHLTSAQYTSLSSPASASIDTDKFLVNDSGVIKYRTGAQVLSDIGAQASGDFLTANVADTKTTGDLTFNDNIRISLGTSGAESDIYSNGTDSYWDLFSGNLIIRDNTTTRFTFGRSTGDLTATGTVQGTRLISTQTTGTAPLTVASTTVVTNLNADLLDGVQGASYLRSDTTDTFTGSELLFGTGTVQLAINTGTGFEIKPSTSAGGWARGLIAEKQSDGLRLGGVGYLGSNESLSSFHVGFQADWWTNSQFKVSPTGDIENIGNIASYDAVNDANPSWSIGSSATERLLINTVYASGTQSLDYVDFKTYTASGTLDRGHYKFSVDESKILEIRDDGIQLAAGKQILGTDSGGTDRSLLFLDSSSQDLWIVNNSGGNGGDILLKSQTGGGTTMAITSGGTVGIGTTGDAGYTFDVSGNSRFSGNLIMDDNFKIGLGSLSGESTFYSNGSNTYLDLSSGDFYIRNGTTTKVTITRANGDITANRFFESSDINLKTNINTLSPTFVSYELKDSIGIKRYGVIAQELERTNPELVNTNDDGLKSVNYTDLLVMKVAEQENKIARLEKLVEELLNR